MRRMFQVLLLILLTVPVSGYTLKGGVTYTVETARQEAFANVEYMLPKEIIEPNLLDPNFRENQRAIKQGLKEIGDRYIGYFSDGSYVIVYKNNQYYEYYYLENGKLEEIGKRIGLSFPTKSFKYNIKGKLELIILYVKRGESYVFNVDGTLEGYWRNKKGYDSKGNLIKNIY